MTSEVVQVKQDKEKAVGDYIKSSKALEALETELHKVKKEKQSLETAKVKMETKLKKDLALANANSSMALKEKEAEIEKSKANFVQVKKAKEMLESELSNAVVAKLEQVSEIQKKN
jgi:hypothetical protein